MKSEWRKVRLGDVCEKITKGTTPTTLGMHFVNQGINFIKSESITANKRLDASKFAYIDSETHEKLSRSQIVENDILFSMAGIYLGKTEIVQQKDTPANTNQAVAIIRVSEKTSHEYIYYYLNQLSIQRFINISVAQSAQPNINLKQIGDITISLPPLPTQRTIAATLSCLDDKIELNNRINANLEAQAQAVFKSWFVDFEPFKDGRFVDSELGRIPKGWRVKTLGEIATVTMGQSPDGSSYNESGDGVVFYQGRAEFGWRFPKNRLFTTQPKRMAKKGDILLSVRAPVGDINAANENCCIGRGLAAINSDNSSFVLYLMKSLKEQMEQYNSQGTVFGCINKNDLNGLKIIIPPASTIEKFEGLCSCIDKTIFNLEIQSRSLAIIRDTLLPKLMSGEVEVGNN
jgi:type I restriction enzyme S subunit